MPDYRDVDPRELRCPTHRPYGADAWKLHRQIRQWGSRIEGMLPPLVRESRDGYLILDNGATRATRVARLLPGLTIRVQVIGRYNADIATWPKIGDTIP